MAPLLLEFFDKCSEVYFMSNRKIMVSVTEVSGDLHAANLVQAVKKIDPRVEFVGIGGEKMERAGVQIRAKTVHMGTVGVIEGVKYYSSFLKIKSKVKRILKEERPDLVILVDSRDFNLRLARWAKKLAIPTIYYIAPPLWAWNDWQIKRAAINITKIIAIFSFEAEVYRKTGANVSFVGYPLVDLVKSSMSKEETLQELGLDGERPIIGLFPGSRGHEVTRLLPLMLKAASKLDKKLKGVQFLLAEASPVFHDKIARIVRESKIPIKFVFGDSYNLMNVSDLLISASGTTTLEASLLGTPMIIVYKTSLSTWLIGQILIKLPYIGLPNIVARKRIVPELVGFKLTANRLANVALDLLQSKKKLEQIRIELRKVAQKLGKPGAVDRAAKIVVEMVNSGE